MKKLLSSILVICFLFIMTGCWGAKEIQNQTYVTGLGLDFSEGQFIVYIQALNFSNIAKLEGGSSLQQAAPIFIGEAKGKTIQSALSILEQNAALPLYYGHVSALLLSKNIIKKKMNSVIEFMGQNPFLRYNCWIFGAEQDIKEILLGESFFNFPSLYTILHDPVPLSEKNFTMPILKYHNFISKYYQPVGTNIIPSIKMNKEYFQEDDKSKNIASITGGFVISGQHYKGAVNKQDLIGLKWFSKNASVIPLSLHEEKVSVLIEKPHTTVRVLKGKKPAYHLIVKANAVLLHNEGNNNIAKIEEELEKEIKNEILKTFDISKQLQADLLNISEKPYRYHHKSWDIDEINSFDKNTIKHIKVKIHIEYPVSYKR